MINTSETINELATALAKAQGEIQDAEKSSDNPFFKSKYADLAECLGQGRPILSKNGLSVVQFPTLESDGWVGLATRLMHSSGEWMESTMAMPVQGKNVAQESGSVLTYMRRYSYCAVCGISQVDQDGNQAGSKSEKLEKPKPRKSADDEKEWYNTVEEDKDGIIGSMQAGRTASQIIATLREKYKVAGKASDRIKEYEREYFTSVA